MSGSLHVWGKGDPVDHNDLNFNFSFFDPTRYLPLIGGALTGPVSGTTGAFTGALSGATVAATGNVSAGAGLTTTGATSSTFGTGTGGSIGLIPGSASVSGILNFGGAGGTIQAASGKPVTIGGGAVLVINNGMSTTFGYAPAAAAIVPNVNLNFFASGSSPSVNPAFINIGVTSDTMALGSTTLSYTTMLYNFGGAALTGQRGGLLVKTTQTATSGNKALGIGNQGMYGAVSFAHQQNATEGGTDTTGTGSWGALFTGGSIIRTLATATNLHEVTNWEADMNTAAPSYKKFGWKVTQLATDVAQGQLDGAYVIENGGTSANNGWHNGFLAIQPNSNFPYDVTGWIFNAPLATDFQSFNTMAGGVNLEPTFTTAAIRSRNFLVDGLGTVRVGNGYLSKSAGGVSLDASGSVGPAEGATLSGAAIVSGGTGYTASFVLYDPYGGSWVVTTQSSNVITSLTCIRTPYFASATPPTNPITLTPTISASGVVGGTVTVNLTWTQPNSTVIGGASTKVGFYGHAGTAQAATPATLADVIAVIRGVGLAA